MWPFDYFKKKREREEREAEAARRRTLKRLDLGHQAAAHESSRRHQVALDMEQQRGRGTRVIPEINIYDPRQDGDSLVTAAVIDKAARVAAQAYCAPAEETRAYCAPTPSYDTSDSFGGSSSSAGSDSGGSCGGSD
jgi:hypothetical protein